MKRFVKRGTNPIDDPYTVKDAIVEQKNFVLVDGKLRPPTDVIWQDIKNKYCFKKSPKALYTFVACNKWNVQVDLGLVHSHNIQRCTTEEQRNSSKTEEENEIIYEDDTDHSHVTFDPEPVKKGTSTFTLSIPKKKWRIIEPEEKTLVVNERGRCDRNRKYTMLKPGIWTDVINNILWDHLKWRCCWRFKWNYISTCDRAKHWIIIRASCTCGNEFTATCPNPPLKDPKDFGLELKFTMLGDREVHTKTGSNRQLAGTKRKELGEEMVSKKLKASHVRKLMASETMDVGDPYPAHIPSNEVVRKIKSDAITSRRLDHDLYKCLNTVPIPFIKTQSMMLV